MSTVPVRWRSSQAKARASPAAWPARGCACRFAAPMHRARLLPGPAPALLAVSLALLGAACSHPVTVPQTEAAPDHATPVAKLREAVLAGLRYGPILERRGRAAALRIAWGQGRGRVGARRDARRRAREGARRAL